MLVRIIGGALIFLSCAALGMYYSLKDSFRIADLSELKKALLLLKGEIDFARSTMPEAMGKVAARTQPKLAAFFLAMQDNLPVTETAAEAWGAAADATLGVLYLDEEDLRNVRALGETLGYLSAKTQIEGLDMTILYIDAQIEKLRATEGRNRRLYQNTGIIFGILLIIVLI